MHHPVVTTGHNGTEPERAHPAQAEPLPVAVGGKMVVSQRRETHPLHLLKQQRDVVNALCDEVGYLIHAQSLAQSAIYLQIWANRKYIILYCVLRHRADLGPDGLKNKNMCPLWRTIQYNWLDY